MFDYKTCYTCEAPSLAHNEIVSTEVVADQMEGTNGHEIYPSSPGMSLCGYSNHKFMLLM